ncbi:glycosyltransferase family 4 protein [Aquipuribacter hungaricus]|uniref:Glycosyltransferase family 4 protein n=1 Tax=Aquipuribacter hungaricus TaxID=545624 RepID=A0ABV7WGK8_9MICO
MRVGVLASVAHRTPPRGYGPWEQVASTIAEGLVARGHDVTLFATADSLTAARLSAVVPAGYEEDPTVEAKVAEYLHDANAFAHADGLDVISNQFDFMPLSYSRLVRTPVVTTVHGFSSPAIVPVYAAFDDVARYVSISDADRHPALTYEATVHHGIDTAAFAVGPGDGGYLLFLGRIHPDKGTHAAIEVARRAGMPLVVAGIVQDARYFAETVEPHLGRDGISYVGPVGPQERERLLGGAAALLHLIGFDEPFGLAVVESLACGTPVVAVERGSMPEILRHGTTGWLVAGVDEAVDAVAALDDLDRAACRQDAVDRFDHDRMVDGYERVLTRVVEEGVRR